MTYNRHQTAILESKFRETSYVSKKQRESLHAQTGLSDRQIKIWFQNRRMKAKKEKDRTNENGEQCVPVPPTVPKMEPRDSCIANSATHAGASEYPSGRSDAEGGSDTACTSSSSISSGPIATQEFGFPWPPLTGGHDAKPPDVMSFTNHTLSAAQSLHSYTVYPSMPVYPSYNMYNGYGAI